MIVGDDNMIADQEAGTESPFDSIVEQSSDRFNKGDARIVVGIDLNRWGIPRGT